MSNVFDSVAKAVWKLFPSDNREQCLGKESIVTNSEDKLDQSKSRFSIDLRILSQETYENAIEVIPSNDVGSHDTAIRFFPPHNKPDRNSTYVKEFQNFTQVFGPKSSQQETFTQVALPLLDELFVTNEPGATTVKPGKSAILFTYGISSSKEYALVGTLGDQGIIPRLINNALARIKQPTLKTIRMQAELYVSCFKIVKEKAYNILHNEHTINNQQPLKIRKENGHTIVRGLAKHHIKSLSTGNKLLTKAINKVKHESNESHIIFQFEVVDALEHSASFWVVDLADDREDKMSQLSCLSCVYVPLRFMWPQYDAGSSAFL